MSWIADRERIQVRMTNLAAGSFGLPGEESNGVRTTRNWHYCREFFLTHQQTGVRTFYFSHALPVGRGRSIAEFITKVEKKLGIKSVRRTNVQATNKKNVVKIHVAPFWDQSDIRRSLFTALLRASLSYRMSANGGKGNFDQALWSVPYLSETRRAVERFLNDRATHYRGPTNLIGWSSSWGPMNLIGWYSSFRNRTNAEIGRFLSKEKKLKT